MGTRHFIGVKQNKEYKVAQYGQWDGYPENKGVRVLEIIKKHRKQIEKILPKVRFFTEKEIEDVDEANWEETHPQLSRDMSVKVLEWILNQDENTDIYLRDRSDWLTETAWAYIIDFDENKLNVYKSCDSFICSFDLDNLPSNDEFIKKIHKTIKAKKL